MTAEASRIAESTAFKLVVPFLQILLAASVTGSSAWIVSAVSTLQTTMNNYQTGQALTIQRVDVIEHRLDNNEKLIDGLRTTTMRLDLQSTSFADNLRSIVHSSGAGK